MPTDTQAAPVGRKGTPLPAKPAAKRPHTLTPMEAERIRLHVKSIARRDLDTATSEPMRDAGQGDVPHDTEGGIASWQAQWNQQATVWPGKALAVFPLTSSTAEVWAYTAQQEPSTLISMCQLFRFPEEVLMRVG
ncbi:hypothetical protein PInf_005810 [Phytophthora infestans]|nr:hypothetical protein PInf_005810 [Phytophthora infestans]